jgi:alcohol dehydrogenase
MKAVLFEAFGQTPVVTNVPDPEPGENGAVLRVEASELAGVVEKAGKNVRGWKKGDRVTVPFSCGCGDCPQCRDGFHNICDNYFQPGFTAWGSFAEYVTIQHADTNLVRLPDELDYVTAASLGCRFVTSFRAVTAQGAVKAGDWVAVHGCGGVGLSAVMIASAMDVRVVGVDIGSEKLGLARDVGAEEVIDASSTTDVVEAVKTITGGGAHVSIDALGSATTCTNSILCLRKRGRHVQVGVMAAEDKDPPLPMGQVMFNELEIIGSHGMQAYEYHRVLDMITGGKLDPKKLIGKTVSLEESIAELVAMCDFQCVGVTVIDRF